ncbi:MAG: hypothetical protein IPP90_19625 [Gemmatimonadaceae bacterium]|nr:hypothetical protein [Gemmatimonadaceae bacterium]
MTRTLTTIALLLTISGRLSPLAAQTGAAVVGKWDIEFARGQRVENDVVTNIMAKGKITIAMSGDSLLATLEVPPRPDGTPVPNATIGGRFTDGAAVFVQKQTVQLNMNGEMHSAEATVTWTLRANGDAMTGGIVRELPGMSVPTEPAPVTGTRSKA